MDDCSTIGLDISSVFAGLVTVSAVCFFFNGFFERTGTVFHESGVIKPNMFSKFHKNNKKKIFLLVLEPGPDET